MNLEQLALVGCGLILIGSMFCYAWDMLWAKTMDEVHAYLSSQTASHRLLLFGVLNLAASLWFRKLLAADDVRMEWVRMQMAFGLFALVILALHRLTHISFRYRTKSA